MKDIEKHTIIQSAWNKIPLIIRSIILGLAISTSGIILWSVVATLIPMPWSFLIMAGLLVIYIIYFSGSWGNDQSKIFRRKNFRNTSLLVGGWRWAMLAAILIVLIEQSGLIVTFRLIEFPADKFLVEYQFLNQVPTWAAWLFIIMISIVAGVCEEIGFRGYIQVPLEHKYGPFLGICIVSILFVIVHLHQAWSGPVIIHIFFISILFGTIAYFSGSLIPGILAHIIMDVFNFSFWWSDLGSQFNETTIFNTGMDAQFIVWLVIFLSGLIVFSYVIKKLSTYKILTT